MYYCSNSNFKINNEKNLYFEKSNFQQELSKIKNNYILFCIEMYIVDNCDISIRTFKDSSIYFNKQKIGINYSLTRHSMHFCLKSTDNFKNNLKLTEQKYN